MIRLIRLISRLPLPVLYFLADLLYFVALYIVRYRKKVVISNFQKCFPDKTPEEIAQLTKQFYKNLSDVIVEIAKSLTIKPEEVHKRVKIYNKELLKHYADQGKSVIALTSHQANWEWVLLSICIELDIPMDAVYRPLSNPEFDKLIFDSRSRFGGSPIPMHKTLREVIRRKNEIRVLGVVADQSPGGSDEKYWTHFLGQETAFYTGFQRIAAIVNYPVVFIRIKRVRRGYYEVFFEPLAEGPHAKEGYDLVEKFARATESAILEAPADWLWSHKRWKFKKE